MNMLKRLRQWLWKRHVQRLTRHLITHAKEVME